jgi:3-hydroxymyristoyl/3-hydroxydecanoyl-(acyl carrier protein) dehydratase
MKLASDLPFRIVASAPGAAEAVVVLDPDFVGFAGHFPGAPVLPAMCHVDLALRAASLAIGEALDLVAVERARFVRKALPGEELRIRLVFRPSAGAVTEIAADHSVGGEAAAEMRLQVTRRTGPPAPR